MPLVSKTFSELITFTRASTATFVGSDGFIQTAAINAPRFDYDPVTLAPKGLLIEEQRTNLTLQSNNFSDAVWGKSQIAVTANAAVSPDGTNNAFKVYSNGTPGGYLLSQNHSVVSGTTYTVSVYLKKAELGFAFLVTNNNFPVTAVSINLNTGVIATGIGTPLGATAVEAGNGYWRVSLSVTATASGAAGLVVYLSNDGLWGNRGGAISLNSGIFVYGAQLEAGAFVTSYIPTGASQVTRSADVAAITGTNFSSWYNQTQGTFVAEFLTVVDPSAGGKVVFSANDATNNNRVVVLTTTAAAEGRIVVGGVATNPVSRGFTAGTIVKSGIAVAAGSGVQYTNGVLNSAVAPSAAPTVDRLEIGNNLQSSQLNGHIRSIRYYPTRLSDAQLQALTA